MMTRQPRTTPRIAACVCGAGRLLPVDKPYAPGSQAVVAQSLAVPERQIPTVVLRRLLASSSVVPRADLGIVVGDSLWRGVGSFSRREDDDCGSGCDGVSCEAS